MSDFTLISSKPFDQVVAAVNAAVGHLNMAEFGRSTHDARSFAELKSAVEKGLSKAGLMLFMQLDQGTVVQKETGQDTPRIIRLFIGNPLIPVPATPYILENLCGQSHSLLWSCKISSLVFSDIFFLLDFVLSLLKIAVLFLS